jgi:ferric-dicitrate binding protein FerR (iron transport regulator)
MRNLFKKYIQSVLNPQEFSVITDFFAKKSNDKLIFSLMKPIWDKTMSDESNQESLNEELKDKILQSVEHEERTAIERKVKQLEFRLRVAAVLLIGIIIGSIFIYLNSPTIEHTAKLQTIHTPYGAKTNFTLPDSSTVWLNSGSTISFLSRFGKSRIIKLTGEASFEIRKDTKPFIVNTEFGEVEVKGTVFNVKAYTDENFQTTLIRGSVKVKEKTGNKQTMLVPGQQAEINGNELSVKEVDTELFDSWKYGKLIFRNEYLPLVTKRLERWYNVKIELANDKRLAEISYTGTLEMETFSEVLQLLQVTAPIKYTYDERRRTIKITYRKT